MLVCNTPSLNNSDKILSKAEALYEEAVPWGPRWGLGLATARKEKSEQTPQSVRLHRAPGVPLGRSSDSPTLQTALPPLLLLLCTTVARTPRSPPEYLLCAGHSCKCRGHCREQEAYCEGCNPATGFKKLPYLQQYSRGRMPRHCGLI